MHLVMHLVTTLFKAFCIIEPKKRKTLISYNYKYLGGKNKKEKNFDAKNKCLVQFKSLSIPFALLIRNERHCDQLLGAVISHRPARRHREATCSRATTSAFRYESGIVLPWAGNAPAAPTGTEHTPLTKMLFKPV